MLLYRRPRVCYKGLCVFHGSFIQTHLRYFYTPPPREGIDPPNERQHPPAQLSVIVSAF